MECVPDLAFLQMAAASNSDMFNKMLWHPSPSAAAAAAAAAAATTSPNSSASATSGTMKQRKTNFTSREVEALLNAVADRKDTVLFGVAGGIGWARAWHEVAQQVSAVEGIHRSESDVRKKWTYLKWEAKNTSKPGRDPTSRAVLDILTTQMRGDQPSNSLLEQLLVPGSPSSPNQSRSTVSPVPIAPKKQSQSSSQSVSSTNSTAQDRQTAQNLQIQQSSQLPQPPEVCLKWNSYHSNMRATFPSLLNNEQFVDVTLACEGRSIKCHKVMLSACSSYFEELLSQNPCQHPIVFMRDLKFWEVQALVEFMYSGEVNVTQDRLPSLLAAADALQIKGLAGPSTGSNSAEDTEDDVIHHVQQQQKRVRKRKSTNPTAYPVRSQCVSQNSKQNVEKVQPTLQHQLKKAHSTPKSTHGVLSSSGYSPPSKTRRDEDPSPNSPLALVKDEPLDLGIDSKNQNRHKTPEPPQTKNEKDENGLCDDEDDDRPDDDAYDDDDKRYDNGNDDDHPSSRESTPKIDK